MRIAMFAVAVATLLTLTACTNPELTAAVQEAKALADQYQSQLEAQKASLEEQRIVAARELAAAKGDHNEAQAATAAAYLAKLDDAAKKVDALLARVTQANLGLDAAVRPDGTVDSGSIGATAGGVIGGPYGAAIGTGIGLLLAAFSNWKRQQAQAGAVSIINGISAVAASVPGFREKLAAGKPLLNAEYTTTAKALVSKHKLATLPKVA